MISISKVHNEDADIACTLEGRGPLLVLVPGGDGNGLQRYAGLAAALSGEYAVLRHDRRACGQSTGDPQAVLDMAQAGRDIAALVRAHGGGPALVFGSSGGGSVALAFAQNHPELVRGLVVHEPACVGVLPDAAELAAFNDTVFETFQRDGVGPAMKLFASRFVGMGPGLAMPPDQGRGMAHMLGKEFLQLNRFMPDFARLRAAGFPVACAGGLASEDAFYVRTARAIAGQLPCPYVEVPGHHVAYAADPASFAQALRPVLAGMLA